MNTARTALILVLTVIASLVSPTFPNDSHQNGRLYDPVPWLEDFHQLLAAMSSDYANLEWAIHDRGMNLPLLRVKTETALRDAHDNAEARHALAKFVNSFGDGHLELDWPKTHSQSTIPRRSADLCGRLGYNEHFKPGINFSLLKQFSPLTTRAGKVFTGGLLKLGSGKTIGVIRISMFSDKVYPDMCRQVLKQMDIGNETDCDSDCANKISIRTADLLTAMLSTRVEELRRAGVTDLLIDITSNDGGSNWAEPPSKVLSSKPLHEPRLGFMKNEHWTRQLQDALKDVKTDLQSGREPKDQLLHAASTLEEAIEVSREHCDRSQVWFTGKLDCSSLETHLLFASGVLSYAEPAEFSGLESRTTLFHPARYTYTEGVNRLPLYVVVDGDTWSAAEYFAALLQDNKAALTIGEITGGAGCGYTNGGIPVQLKNSKADVKMPDCVRMRADGSNEVDGVIPDVLIPWASRDSELQRTNKLLKALKSLQ